MNADEALGHARALMERAAKDDDFEALDRIAELLPQKLPTHFPALVDAAQGASLAARILEQQGDVDAVPARRAVAVQSLLLALDLAPERRDVVAKYAEGMGLTDEPKLAERLAK